MQIKSPHLSLRDMENKDRDTLVHWLQPHHQWHNLNGPYYSRTPSDAIPGIVERGISNTPPDIRERMVIATVDMDRVIGMVTRHWISEETQWLELGITIYDPENWGKGLGYAALGLWADYQLHANEELPRLDLRTWSGNIGMMRLAEKLGFLREATFRNARMNNGKYYDGMGYGILREEWVARYPKGFSATLK